MVNNNELQIFIHELKRLEEDYQNNDNDFLKEEIMKDMELLRSVISEAKIEND